MLNDDWAVIRQRSDNFMKSLRLPSGANYYFVAESESYIHRTLETILSEDFGERDAICQVQGLNSEAAVIAAAGRRIDQKSTVVQRFSPKRIGAVRERIFDMLTRLNPLELVSSAACGADLLTLEACHKLGISTHIILPCAPRIFRAVSVVDRGEAWGALFDFHLKVATSLTVLSGGPDYAYYLSANVAIIDKARRLREKFDGPCVLIGLVVWDNKASEADDVTAHFKMLAAGSGFEIETISTR